MLPGGMLRASSLALLLAISGASPVLAQDWWEHPPLPIERPGAVEVNSAIELGLEWLLEKQRQDGSWAGHGGYPMGQTALMTLTLLKSGLSMAHDPVRRALDYLQPLPMRKTYSAGVLLQMIEALGEPDHPIWRAKAEEAARFLVANRQAGAGGYWAYPDGAPDLSNTQYALLGLRSAHRLGIAVPLDAFTDVCGLLARYQNDDGGLGYKRGELSRGSMTLAALGVLTISEEVAGETPAWRRGRSEYGHCRQRAHQWLEQHFTVFYNPQGPRGALSKYHLGYYLYSLERYGDLAELDTIAGRDWYGEGAGYLLANQLEGGRWGYEADTAFALLFLQRASLTGGRKREKLAVEVREKILARRKAERDRRPRPEAGIPFLTDWLVAGPLRVEDESPWDIQRFPVPKRKPAPGAGFGKLKWELYRSPAEESFVDLQKALRPIDWAVGYAATYLSVPAPTEAILWLGSDDGWRVILNGEIVDELDWFGGSAPDRHAIPLKLEKGANALVLQISESVGTWGFHARVSDARGKPVPTLSAKAAR